MEMKSVKNVGTVMFYTRNIKKEKQIAALCRGLNFTVRTIKPQDINKPLGSICVQSGIKANSPKAKGERVKAPDNYRLPELIIFSGLSDEALDRFLEEYKGLGIEPVGLKAVVTPTNISWSVYELVCELEKERMQWKR